MEEHDQPLQDKVLQYETSYYEKGPVDFSLPVGLKPETNQIERTQRRTYPDTEQSQGLAKVMLLLDNRPEGIELLDQVQSSDLHMLRGGC